MRTVVLLLTAALVAGTVLGVAMGWAAAHGIEWIIRHVRVGLS